MDDGYKFTCFEGGISEIETNHKLDVLFGNLETNETISLEFKNWANVNNIDTTDGSQLRAYLLSQRDFRYYFNGNTEEMKIVFQNIFKDPNKAQELFELNTNFFMRSNVFSHTELNELAISEQLPNHPLLDFLQ